MPEEKLSGLQYRNLGGRACGALVMELSNFLPLATG
jgi:hypothetical protein